jgi:alpha-D-xyloside xylohydrolase
MIASRFLVFLFVIVVGALGNIISWQKEYDGVLFRLDNGALRLQIWNTKIIRVLYSPTQTFPAKHSFSVIAQPLTTLFNVYESSTNVTLSTQNVLVNVDKKSTAVTFFEKKDQLIVPMLYEVSRNMTPTTLVTEKTFIVQQDFKLLNNEDFYGLGQHQGGEMSYRGNSVKLEQVNREIAIPFLVSSMSYGVLWDNPSSTIVSIGANGRETISWSSEIGDIIDYYFLNGRSLDEVQTLYGWLTGRAPLYPRW